MRLVILYGSQTGTAQDVAEQIWRESKQFGCTGPVLPMDEYPIEHLLEETIIVFVVATTGNGDEPDNMKKTWKRLLRRNLPEDLLQRLQYACLGLGDSSYAKYNFAAKKLNRRLQQLGASTLLPLGLCDDQHDYGLHAVALPWIEQLWKKLSGRLPLQQRTNETIFKWRMSVLQDAPTIDLDQMRWPFQESPKLFEVKQNQRTTSADHFQDVRLLKLEYPLATCSWMPGDVLQLRPSNASEQVQAFFDLVKEHNLDFNADTIVQLSTAHDDMPVPVAYAQPVTVGVLAQYIWDLSAKPRQRAFELLALNCDDELEKEKLVEFTTAEGLDNMVNYINRPRRTILEVLQDFRHATSKLTLPLLFELFSIIQVRSFSIASVPTTGTLDVLVAVVEYNTKMSTPRLGLCSNWIKSLTAETRILGAIRSGTMTLPRDVITPIVMIGPGTGIAPFRSIIQHREQQKANGIEIGALVVFFGCRNKSKDFHFANDLLRWQDEQLIDLYVAFSRDQENKVYVQHLICEHSLKLKALIKYENAFILVAGSSNNMPKAVKEAFIELLDEDENYVEEMIKTKRYQEETWS